MSRASLRPTPAANRSVDTPLTLAESDAIGNALIRLETLITLGRDHLNGEYEPDRTVLLDLFAMLADGVARVETSFNAAAMRRLAEATR